jgi:hypothetical protein
MIFCPKDRAKVVSDIFPAFNFGGAQLQFVSMFRYLGHILNASQLDDEDISREVRNLFIRTNILKRKFGKCSVNVKLILFKSYCSYLYDTAVWSRYSLCVLHKLKAAYHTCIKSFIGYSRSDSVTQLLVDLQLPSFDTLLCTLLIFS